jgi:hypothetical protein
MLTLKPFIAMLLTASLLAAQPAAIPSKLNVTVLEGEGAFNNIKLRLGRNLRIAVRDEAGEPVPGAKVVFSAPVVGPGVTFGKSGNKFETVTDERGQASTAELVPNASEGTFGVRVIVSAGELQHTHLVRQSNTLAGGIPDPKKKSGGGGKKALIIALIAGGVATGLAIGLLGGDDDTTINAPSISIDNINVGGPR